MSCGVSNTGAGRAFNHKWLGVIFGRQACNRHARIPRLEEFVSIWLAACGPVGLYISCKTDSNSGGAFWRGKFGLPRVNSRYIHRQKSSSPTHRGKSKCNRRPFLSRAAETRTRRGRDEASGGGSLLPHHAGRAVAAPSSLPAPSLRRRLLCPAGWIGARRGGRAAASSGVAGLR